MQIEERCFTKFTVPTEQYDLPKRFTFPFYYQPHPLCVLAAKQLQQHLSTQKQWQHNFGLSDDPTNIIGKMFGVLLVRNERGELGFISAFSGKLAEQNHIQGFVPPVFDLLVSDSFFLNEKITINELNEQIDTLANTPQLASLQRDLQLLETQQQQKIDELKVELIENRKKRKKQRQLLQSESDNKIADSGLQALAQQSVFDKWRLKELNEHSQQLAQKLQLKIEQFTTQISELKRQRKKLSAELQNKIFSHYQFLNQAQQSKNLLDIFAETAMKIPPAGAGECAAPKLLHYAFLHRLTPLAMAEFWWGASPKSEVKKHQQYYPACTGKCQPILKHMLAGITLDENPLIFNYGEDKNLELVYQDADILIVNKPTEFLSVPGKEISDSVYQRIKEQFPQATGALIVHRLDMSTSGLMVLGLHAQANKYLQKQFIQRQVHKKYVAIIEGIPQQDQGEIRLPLTGDFYDRPKQLVCFEAGKPAHTSWQVLERYPNKNQTRVLLTPHTGRTHQLRVHCAHKEGLNMPILGDDLYGVRGKRLHLHAQTLEIIHPVSNAAMSFSVDAEF